VKKQKKKYYVGVIQLQILEIKISLSFCVLGLAGMQLIFFIAASVMICFTFVTKTVWLTQRCFNCYLNSACTAPRTSLFPILPPPNSRLGVGKKKGADTSGTADPKWPNGYPIPYDTMLSNKSWG